MSIDFEAGSSQVLTVPDNALLRIGGDYALTAHVKAESIPSAGNLAYIFGKGATAGNEPYFLRLSGTSILDTYYNGGGASWTHSGAFVAGVQYSIIVNCAGGTITLYVDGVPKATGSKGADKSDATTLAIGGYGGGTGRPWDGLLEDVRIYDDALTVNEIARISGGETGLLGDEVARWSCIKANGVGTFIGASLGAANTIPDDSGHGLIATPVNTPVGATMLLKWGGNSQVITAA